LDSQVPTLGERRRERFNAFAVVFRLAVDTTERGALAVSPLRAAAEVKKKSLFRALCARQHARIAPLLEEGRTERVLRLLAEVSRDYPPVVHLVFRFLT